MSDFRNAKIIKGATSLFRSLWIFCEKFFFNMNPSPGDADAESDSSLPSYSNEAFEPEDPIPDSLANNQNIDSSDEPEVFEYRPRIRIVDPSMRVRRSHQDQIMAATRRRPRPPPERVPPPIRSEPSPSAGRRVGSASRPRRSRTPSSSEDARPKKTIRL